MQRDAALSYLKKDLDFQSEILLEKVKSPSQTSILKRTFTKKSKVPKLWTLDLDLSPERTRVLKLLGQSTLDDERENCVNQTTQVRFSTWFFLFFAFNFCISS